jgi:3-dehydroquinate synthase
MLKGGVDRSSVVVTLGGGVVGDIGGFAAATFMRGIPVVHIPTTLLAQVDAGVGGKTAIDFCGIKNSIGVFHQPSAVVIDVQMLSTLPHRQLVSGFAEIIKHAIIADKDFFILLSKKKISEIKNNEWMHIISKSIEIKTNIVEQDENEKNGIRKQLNFGHTIGHAVEALSLKTNHPLLHGEAVAIGMMAEARMSRLAGLLSKKEEELIISVLWHLENLKHISGISFSQIHHIIKTDKKNKKEILLWSLPIAIGKVQSDLILTGEVVKKGILSITE